MRNKAFISMLRASFVMLLRNRLLLITSLGLALISIFVFGWLFGSGGSPTLRLGLVDQDHTPLSGQLASQLRSSASISLHTGGQVAELAALRSGGRDAVLVIPGGLRHQYGAGNIHAVGLL